MNLVPNEVYPWIAQYPQISAGLMAGNEIAKSLVGMTDTILNRPESMVDPVYLSGGMDEQKLAKLEAADPYTQMQWASALGANRHSNEPLQDVNPPEGYVVRRNAEGGLELAVKPEGTDLGHGGSAAYNTAVDLGRFMQLGSGAGPMAAPGALAVQALGEAPSALDAMGMFAGTRATRAPIEQFFKRDLLRNAGYTDPQAWQMTGVGEPFAGQSARWEIPDNPAAISPEATRVMQQQGSGQVAGTGTLEQVLQHPELFNQYPALSTIKTTIKLDPNNPMYEQGAAGWFAPDMNDTGAIQVTGKDLKQVLSTLLHEAQHGVQQIEGWQGGGSSQMTESLFPFAKNPLYEGEPNNALNYYLGIPGEVEARNTQIRQGLNSAHRRALYPHVTQDIVPGTEVYPTAQMWERPLPQGQNMNKEWIRALLSK